MKFVKAVQKLRIVILCLAVVMFFVSSVFSADNTVPWYEKTQISGKAYMGYAYQTKPKGDTNAFELNRFYLTTTSKIADDVNLKLTLDAYPVTNYDSGGNSKSNFYTYIKHGLLEIKINNYSLLLGQQDLPWVPFEEGIWGYRFQGTVFPDREGYLTSTDIGLGLKYKKENLDTHIALVNGTGYRSNEDNKYKDIHWRISLGNLNKVLLTAFTSYGWKNVGGDRYRMIFQVAKSSPNYTIAGEYLQAKDPNTATADKKAKGFAIFGHYSLVAGYPEGSGRIIARLDWLDSNTDSTSTGDKKTRYIIGYAYKFRKSLEFLLDYEGLKYESGSSNSNLNKILGQLEVKF